MMDIFINSTSANFHHNAPSRCASRTSSVESQREAAEGGGRSLDRQGDHVPAATHVDLTDFQTVKRVLDVLKEGRMDVAGFLDALCWGN